MKKLLFLAIVLGLSFAELKYNPSTGLYENAPQNAEYKYNFSTQKSEYVAPGATMKYNFSTGKYYYDNYEKKEKQNGYN